MFQRVFSLFAGKKQPKQVGKMPESLKTIEVRSDNIF